MSADAPEDHPAGVRLLTRAPVTPGWLSRSVVPLARAVRDSGGAVVRLAGDGCTARTWTSSAGVRWARDSPGRAWHGTWTPVPCPGTGRWMKRPTSRRHGSSAGWKPRATPELGLGFLGRLGEITDLVLALHLLRECVESTQRVHLGRRNRPRRGLHLRPRDLGNPAYLLPDGHGLLDQELRSDHVCHRSVLLGQVAGPGQIAEASSRWGTGRRTGRTGTDRALPATVSVQVTGRPE